jgi:hypothetical protein
LRLKVFLKKVLAQYDEILVTSVAFYVTNMPEVVKSVKIFKSQDMYGHILPVSSFPRVFDCRETDLLTG